MKKISLIIIMLVASLTSCTKDMVPVTPIPEPGECEDTVSYIQVVQPLLDLNCSTSGCHNSSGAGGYVLTTHEEVSTASSAVFAAMNHTGPNPMPIGADKLPDSLIKQFECWITQGKLNN